MCRHDNVKNVAEQTTSRCDIQCVNCVRSKNRPGANLTENVLSVTEQIMCKCDR